MKYIKNAPFIALAVACLVLSGCGKEEIVGPDPAPFEAAINAYCVEHHMDMVVSKFKSIEIEGDKAIARPAMQDKAELYSLTVVWEVYFERAGEGWKVTKAIR